MNQDAMSLSAAQRNLAENITEIRKRRRMSQKQLAEVLGVNRTYLNGLEKGVRNPSVTMLYHIAEGLHISVKDLLTKHEEFSFGEDDSYWDKVKEAVEENKKNDFKKLAQLRHESSMMQEELAKKAGISRNHVSGMERGVHKPTLGTLARLANALGCNITEFFY